MPWQYGTRVTQPRKPADEDWHVPVKRVGFQNSKRHGIVSIMNRRGLAFILCLVGGALGAMPVAAQDLTQDLTEDEIIDRFQQQKTRGLKIAPIGQATGSNDTVTTAAAAPDADMRILPADQQVNLNISFDFDSAALRDDQKPRLASMCNAMKAVDSTAFVILGHTDASGSDSYNQRLSQLRAEEVKRFLEADTCGIEPGRLVARGMGEAFPLDAADPRADVNRRVEFQVGS